MAEKNEIILNKQVIASLGIAEKLREIMPRHQCEYYVNTHGGESVLLTKSLFDDLFRKEEFAEGPHKDSFGDGNEPYNPDRQAFGTLKDGRVVYCELSEKMQEKVKVYLESLV